MDQIIIKRQLYKLKRSLHLGEAPLPDETMSKASCNVTTMRDHRRVPRVQTHIPFYRREYEVITVRHWNVPQLRGRSTFRGPNLIIIAKPRLQHEGGAIIITASHNVRSIQPSSVRHPFCQNWPMKRQALQPCLNRGACFIHSSIEIKEAQSWLTTLLYHIMIMCYTHSQLR